MYTYILQVLSYREERLLHSVFKYYQFSFWPQIHQCPWIGLSFHGQSAPITDTKGPSLQHLSPFGGQHTVELKYSTKGHSVHFPVPSCLVDTPTLFTKFAVSETHIDLSVDSCKFPKASDVLP